MDNAKNTTVYSKSQKTFRNVHWSPSKKSIDRSCKQLRKNANYSEEIQIILKNN